MEVIKSYIVLNNRGKTKQQPTARERAGESVSASEKNI